jgi:4-alpha-glucanotransferase
LTNHRDERTSLRKLARAHRVQTGFVGTDRRRHAASDDALVGALRALGVPIGRPAEASELLAGAASDRSRHVLEPVCVHRQGGPLSLVANLRAGTDLSQAWLNVHVEGDAPRRLRLGDTAAVQSGTRGTDRDARDTMRFDLGTLELPVGYHRVELDTHLERASSLLLSAPANCPRPARKWGVGVPLYALRSEQDWGSGSFGELAELGAWSRAHGASFVATLPLCPTFSDVDFADPSPYMPVSRLAWNDMFLDVTALPELAGSPEASQIIGEPSFVSRVAVSRSKASCDPREVTALKQAVLTVLARAVLTTGSRRRGALEHHVRGRPELGAYACFRARCERLKRPWWEWHESERCSRDSSSGDVEEQIEAALSGHDDTVLTHLYAQWAAEDQLSRAAEQSGGLHLDLPVGVHPAGFDPMWERTSFASAASVGAPPDGFFPGGQVWGFPPLHPQRAREDGYRYFVACLRHSMRHAASVRLDHVMGLHRSYWIPEGLDARDGVYVRYCADELHAVVCIEAHLAQAAVIGEDLGTVPGSVRRAMSRDGMLRSSVFEFESSAQNPLPELGEDCIASLSTHDLPPFASYWKGDDVEDRLGRGQIEGPEARSELAGRARWRRAVLAAIDAEDERAEGRDEIPARGSLRKAFAGCISHLARSRALLVLVDLEDTWFETEPQNRPGTGPEQANFTRRAAPSMEEFMVDPQVIEMLEGVRRGREEARGITSERAHATVGNLSELATGGWG